MTMTPVRAATRDQLATPLLRPCGTLSGARGAPHELRHTAASLAIAAGASVKAVQLMLGHSSAAMTLDRYGHLFPDELDAVAERLDEAHSRAVADRVRTNHQPKVGEDDDTAAPDPF